SVVARGIHLDAIRSRGLVLRKGGQEKLARVRASADTTDLGHQDIVFCTLKAHQALEAAERFVPLLGPETAVVTAMNGIPCGISTNTVAKARAFICNQSTRVVVNGI